MLVGLFDRDGARRDELALVSGYSGVGKSALVAEMGRAIVQRHGYLVEGKFDQFQQATAYGAIAAAFRALVDQLLGEPAAHLAAWRAALQQGLGVNAAARHRARARAGMVIGEPPPVPELPPAEAQTRFQLTFASFVKVFATAEHPLVLFMDDLQWSDVPTLNLLARLATARDVGHLLIIGAYRTTRWTPTHPLTVTLDQLRKVTRAGRAAARSRSQDRPWTELMADTLRSRAARSPRRSAAWCSRRRRAIHSSCARSCAPARGAAPSSSTATRGAGGGTRSRSRRRARRRERRRLPGRPLRRLPAETQEVLQLAACIGGTFDLGTLALIAERSTADDSRRAAGGAAAAGWSCR